MKRIGAALLLALTVFLAIATTQVPWSQIGDTEAWSILFMSAVAIATMLGMFIYLVSQIAKEEK